MLACRGFLRGFSLAALVCASSALSQNLLVNSGFDRDLSGWTVAIVAAPDAWGDPQVTWTPTDAWGLPGSGAVHLHIWSEPLRDKSAAVSQCVVVPEGRSVTFGAKVSRGFPTGLFDVYVGAEVYGSPGCDGARLSSAHVSSVDLRTAWVPTASSIPTPPGARSMKVSVAASASGVPDGQTARVDVVWDDVFAFVDPAPAATNVLPSAARIRGASGAVWTTTLALVNAGPDDALATLKFLEHDADGRNGPEATLLVPGGRVLWYDDALFSLFWKTDTWGAFRVTSTSASLFVEAETSSGYPPPGAAGQFVPGLAPEDFAGATPKTLAPIRENALFRTNLVLANAAEIPVTAHVELFAADGASVGSRDVDLPPLGMTQINRVAAVLGAASLDAGRISVSTTTPGGVVAAYASVIDNVTNDPRTLLPQDGTVATQSLTASNLLVNPGFDRDLSGWTSRTTAGSSTVPTADTFVAWEPEDAGGSLVSGGAGLHAKALEPGTLAAVRQCVDVSSPALVSFGARFLTRSERLSVVGVTTTFFGSAGCAGTSLSSASTPSLPSSPTVGSSSGGAWLPVQTSALVPASARSAVVEARANALFTLFYGIGWADVVVDDVFFTVAPSQEVVSILPSAAWISGSGAYWSTHLTLINAGTADAAVTLKWLGHDADGRGGPQRAYLVRAGETVGLNEEEWEISHPQDYGAILVTSSSPALFLQSETSTSSPGGGTVGQALMAFGASDFAGAIPKSLAPIRENGSSRTNLVLANPTEIPVTAHVALHDAVGTQIGSRDVDLPPLGMTQINNVAPALGVASLAAGRVSVSTSTPGGLVAAYASVIDDASNDPRTLLPR